MMDRLEGPINSCFFGEHLEVNCLEQGFINTEEDERFFISSSLEDENMPFLQMLQSVESSPQQFFPFSEANFQTLLRLQHLKNNNKQPWEEKAYVPKLQTQIQAIEPESCVTNDVVEIHSPVKSETNEDLHLLPHSSTMVNTERPNNQSENCSKRRKRKRTRPMKNKEEVENQRMTHIAVERNRRRQMNDHLNVLKTLMPSSYIQRGDQASIIGGAIDFVKELEQLLQSLEAQKRNRKNEEIGSCSEILKPSSSSLRYEDEEEENDDDEEEDYTKEPKIETTVIQTHVNLKIRCRKSQGQLVKAIVGLEELRLSVLHLNITSSQSSVLYCFNLKIEEECKLGSANEITEAVRHIFKFINGS